MERIFREQIDLAQWHTQTNTSHSDEALHETRKALKRARSALRLVRSALGDGYAREDAVMRRISRKLSPARDAQALVESFDDLADAGELESIKQGLMRRKERATSSLHRRGGMKSAASLLDSLAGRIQKMPWDRVNVETVLSGFERTVRRGRKAWEAARAKPHVETFHQLRKRSKDLRYQLTLVKQLWKDVIGGYSASAKRLEGRLGDDHNLAIIGKTVRARPASFGSKKDVRTLLRRIDQRCDKLQRQTMRVAGLIYAEKPSEWRSRLERTLRAKR
jgi:CHAD domain-containing protein